MLAAPAGDGLWLPGRQPCVGPQWPPVAMNRARSPLPRVQDGSKNACPAGARHAQTRGRAREDGTGQPGAGQLGTRRRSPSHSLPTRSMRRAAWGRGSHSLAHCRGCRHRAGPRRQTGRAWGHGAPDAREPDHARLSLAWSRSPNPQSHGSAPCRARPGRCRPRSTWGRHSAGVTNVTPPCAVSGRRLLMAQTPAFTGPLPPSVRSPLG